MSTPPTPSLSNSWIGSGVVIDTTALNLGLRKLKSQLLEG